MILDSTPTNEAIMSGVGAVSSFTIKATAKSFSILSSGLYANKVRAIVRELSCNAIDAHVAANNLETPYEVHLPTQMEPYFSVRDFGIGLNHEEVVNIFTSFFESTKTSSNDFIGALGLGSKSPFSYTDNFTVTATKNGVRGIYTAFISDAGVPSIALMYTEDTTDGNGVEIKFAVTDRYDFSKFRDEARHVYKYFKNRPVITGQIDFEFAEPEYDVTDIIPGVHSNGGYHCIAVMGNIAYPIELPNPEQLGDVAPLLNCGLVLEFNIGELDFQASREGLSYIPLTINSIKNKLETVNSSLSAVITKEAEAIENEWERALMLHKKRDQPLWRAAVEQYIDDSGFALLHSRKTSRWDSLHTFKLYTNQMLKKYNVTVRAFTRNRNAVGCTDIKTSYELDDKTKQTVGFMPLRVDSDTFFVFNDTKTGATERTKYHWRNRSMAAYTERVYVIEAADKNKPIKREQFLKFIHNPPVDKLMVASSLDLKERVKTKLGKNVNILHLEERNRGYGYYNRSTEMVWADAGTADTFDKNTTHYYLPLSGFQSLGIVDDIKRLQSNLHASGIWTGAVYGVRKGDMEWVKEQSNWKNLDEFVINELKKLDSANVMEVVKQSICYSEYFTYAVTDIDATSPYMILKNEFAAVKDINPDNRRALEYLCRVYSVSTTEQVEPTELIKQFREQMLAVKARYPMIDAVRYSGADAAMISEYVRAIDMMRDAMTKDLSNPVD
jgi:hypothetical protein